MAKVKDIEKLKGQKTTETITGKKNEIEKGQISKVNENNNKSNINSFIKSNYKKIILILLVAIVVIGTGLYILTKNGVINLKKIENVNNNEQNNLKDGKSISEESTSNYYEHPPEWYEEQKNDIEQTNNINTEKINYPVTMAEFIEQLMSIDQYGERLIQDFAKRRLCNEIHLLSKDTQYTYTFEYCLEGNKIRFYITAAEPTTINGNVGYNIYGYKAIYAVTTDSLKYAKKSNSAFRIENVPVSQLFNIQFEEVYDKTATPSSSYKDTLKNIVTKSLNDIFYIDGTTTEKDNNTNDSSLNSSTKTIADVLNDTQYFEKYSLNVINNAKILTGVKNYEDLKMKGSSDFIPHSYSYEDKTYYTEIKNINKIVKNNTDDIYNQKFLCDYKGYCYIRKGVDLSKIKIEYEIEYEAKRKGDSSYYSNFGYIFTPKLQINGNTLTIELNADCITDRFYG